MQLNLGDGLRVMVGKVTNSQLGFIIVHHEGELLDDYTCWYSDYEE